jgi:hypothetical protein
VRIMSKALLIIHLSSLDAYADRYGIDEAEALASRMRKAIMEHKGPVYIVDQRWPLVEPHSMPRFDLVNSVQLARDIEWRHWEEWMEWEKFLKELRSEMRRAGVSEVVLGGVWYDPAGELGCVTESVPILKRLFRVKVDRDIVGCVTAEKAG